MTQKEKKDRMESMGWHLTWLQKEDQARWSGAMFALSRMGYKVDVDRTGRFIVTEGEEK